MALAHNTRLLAFANWPCRYRDHVESAKVRVLRVGRLVRPEYVVGQTALASTRIRKGRRICIDEDKERKRDLLRYENKIKSIQKLNSTSMGRAPSFMKCPR